MKFEEIMLVKIGGKILVFLFFLLLCFIFSFLLEELGNRNIFFVFWEGYKRL